jgi:hypothetical protein
MCTISIESEARGVGVGLRTTSCAYPSILYHTSFSCEPRVLLKHIRIRSLLLHAVPMINIQSIFSMYQYLFAAPINIPQHLCLFVRFPRYVMRACRACQDLQGLLSSQQTTLIRPRFAAERVSEDAASHHLDHVDSYRAPIASSAHSYPTCIPLCTHQQPCFR